MKGLMKHMLAIFLFLITSVSMSQVFAREDGDLGRIESRMRYLERKNLEIKEISRELFQEISQADSEIESQELLTTLEKMKEAQSKILTELEILKTKKVEIEQKQEENVENSQEIRNAPEIIVPTIHLTPPETEPKKSFSWVFYLIIIILIGVMWYFAEKMQRRRMLQNERSTQPMGQSFPQPPQRNVSTGATGTTPNNRIVFNNPNQRELHRTRDGFLQDGLISDELAWGKESIMKTELPNWVKKNPEKYKKRLLEECKILARFYPAFEMHIENEELYIFGPLVTRSGNAYMVKVYYPADYPASPPEPIILDRDVVNSETPHTYGYKRDGIKVCVINPRDGTGQAYIPSMTGVTFLNYTAAWLHAYEYWSQTKKWPSLEGH